MFLIGIGTEELYNLDHLRKIEIFVGQYSTDQVAPAHSQMDAAEVSAASRYHVVRGYFGESDVPIELSEKVSVEQAVRMRDKIVTASGGVLKIAQRESWNS